MLDLITYMETSQNYRKLHLLNVEWRDYFIWLANFYEMLMIDVINKMLVNAIINLVSFFVNKFTLSIMTLNNVIYFLFIAFLQYFTAFVIVQYYHCTLSITFKEQVYQLRIVISRIRNDEN